MPKLPPLKPREVARVLERLGFIFARQKGSHRIYVRDRMGITVPDHARELKKGTLLAIIRATGLAPEEFIKLLK